MSDFVESLEGRRLMSAAAFTSIVPLTLALQPVAVSATVTESGTLLIEGTTQNDSITVTTTKPNSVTTVVVHVIGGKIATGDSIFYVDATTVKQDTLFAVDSALVKRIQIDGGAGNDSLSIQDIDRKGLLIGGKGNDNLFGGKQGDTLSGGDGNDVLEAAVATAESVVVTQNPVVTPKPVSTGGKLFIPGTKKTTSEKLTLTNTFISGGIDEGKDSADLLQGGKGNDTLHSGNGPDTIDGGAGSDVLIAQGRGTVPKGLTKAGETPVDYEGLTVISIEAASATAAGDTIQSIFGAGGSAQYQLITGTKVIG
jgi:Ca2+-binding RTX toxin-like protein